MATITFGGKACIDTVSALESCQRLRLPVDWYNNEATRPNSFINPRGVMAGRGFLLLDRASLDDLDVNVTHDLVMSLDTSESLGAIAGQSWSITHKTLHIVDSLCITPGLRADPKSCYLVEVADRRRIAQQVPINASYNHRQRAPLTDDYYSGSLNGGSAWTWSEMVEDVWDTVGLLGSYPGLPFTPDGTPENFLFWGMYALDALGMVLARIACTLKLDTQADTFSIVQLCDADLETDTEATLTTRDKLRILDDDRVTPDYGRFPESVSVFFPVRGEEPTTTGASPFIEVSVDASTVVAAADLPATLAADTAVILYDEMTADWTEAGGTANLAALTTRAEERAGDYYRQLLARRIRRFYGTLLSDTSLTPGAWIRATRWGDRGHGFITEIIRLPGDGIPSILAPVAGITRTDSVTSSGGTTTSTTTTPPTGSDHFRTSDTTDVDTVTSVCPIFEDIEVNDYVDAGGITVGTSAVAGGSSGLILAGGDGGTLAQVDVIDGGTF